MVPSLALFAYIIDAHRKSSWHVQLKNEDTSNRKALFEITPSQHFVGKTELSKDALNLLWGELSPILSSSIF